MFQRFAGKRVKYFGDKFAAFGKPSDEKNGIFYGIIITWTQIDKNQPMIDTVLLEKPKDETVRSLSIPDNLGFNSQFFYYAFRVSDHTLVFESKNSFGATIGSYNAEKIFRAIFNERDLPKMRFKLGPPRLVEVDLVLQTDTLDRMFSIKTLTSITINISIANPDDNTDDADKIIDRLTAIKARRQTVTYEAIDRKQGLKIDQKMINEGEAGIVQGSIQAEGVDNGKRISLNSKSYPRREVAFILPASSAVDSVLRMAEKFFKR